MGWCQSVAVCCVYRAMSHYKANGRVAGVTDWGVWRTRAAVVAELSCKSKETPNYDI